MKQYLRRVCSVFFLTAVIAVIWFLHLFIQVDDTMKYINWDSSVQIAADGTEQPFPQDSGISGCSGTFRFTGKLPEGLPAGSLLFETTGLDLSLSLNGSEIWKSRAKEAGDGGYMLAQAVIPLAENSSGELTVTCTSLDGSVSIIPPLVRFVPEFLDITESTALANREAFPAGAASFALILVFGIFLLGITLGKPDWSLIPLLFAVAGFAFFRLVKSQGYYFLPEDIYQLLAQRETGLFIILAFVLYLAMNRRRFWNCLGIAAAWSAAGFLLCYLVSLAVGSYFSYLVNTLLEQFIQSGYYDGIVYWCTLWLALTCALISAYGVIRSFAEQQTEAQGLLLKNKMISENYHALQDRITETSALQHEINHQLTALECLCQKEDYKGMKEMLSQMQAQQHARTPASFTPNRTVDIILQDAAERARQQNTRFQALVNIPDELNIPESDLCSLLMNMLDNALEGAEKVTPAQDRYLSVRIRVSGLYFAVKCENSFNGEIREDKNGNLLTTKENADAHGFGCRQMKKIAEKYQSIIRFDTQDNNIFIAQTALRIPDK